MGKKYFIRETQVDLIKEQNEKIRELQTLVSTLADSPRGERVIERVAVYSPAELVEVKGEKVEQEPDPVFIPKTQISGKASIGNISTVKIEKVNTSDVNAIRSQKNK